MDSGGLTAYGSQIFGGSQKLSNPRPPAFLAFPWTLLRPQAEKGPCKAGALPLRHKPTGFFFGCRGFLFAPFA